MRERPGHLGREHAIDRERPPAATADHRDARGSRTHGDQASGTSKQERRRFLSHAAHDHVGDLLHAGGRAYVGHDHLGHARRQPPPDQCHRHHAASGNGTSGTGTGGGSNRAGAAGSGRSISSYIVDRISAALRPGAELARARISAYREGP